MEWIKSKMGEPMKEVLLHYVYELDDHDDKEEPNCASILAEMITVAIPALWNVY